MSTKENKQEQIWSSLFLVLPTLILMRVGDYFSQDSLDKSLYSGLFAAIGAIIGYGTFYLVKSKKSSIKLIALFSLVFLSGLAWMLIFKYSYR